MKRLTLVLLVAALVLSCTKNTRPVASITVNPQSGATGTIFTFDAGESSDAETCPCELCYRWDWESDGRWDTGWIKTSINTHQYESAGIYTIKLEVADEEGLTDQTNLTIRVDETIPSFTDTRDGNVYNFIKIGQQVWMTRNLAYLPKVSPPGEGSDWTDTLKYYYIFAYEGNDVMQAKQTAAYLTYGVLYNWQAALTACPSGWHLPSDQEWTTLSDFLGDQAGGKIKEAGYDHWDKPNTGATNESGFTAFAGGHRNYTGNFQDLWIDANFWTATADDAMHSWGRYIGYTFSGISRFNYLRNYGFSVRCVKDAGQ